MSEATRVMLNNVRLAFPVLDEPEQFQGSGKPRYSAVLLVEPGSENDKKIEAALRKAAGEQWGEANIEAIRDLALQLKGEFDATEKIFFVAGVRDEQKCALMVMMSDTLVATGLNAGTLVKEAAKMINGGGGGQPHFAMAGGKNPDGIDAAVDAILESAGLK